MIGLLTTVILFYAVVSFMGSLNKKKESEGTLCEGRVFSSEVDETVYIAHRSKKYHSSGCHFISGDEIPISRSNARGEGYAPCKVCKPD